MINYLDKLDKKYSCALHTLDFPPITIILYPFALFFNYKLFIIHIALIAFICKESIIFPLAYTLTVIVSVATTLFLKQILKRPRPIPYHSKSKPMTFRLMEGNNSMPSGDSMQSAVFVYYILLPIVSISVFEIGVALMFVTLVGLARVYYRCHYLADVFVGAILGYLNGVVTHKITEIIFFYISL